MLYSLDLRERVISHVRSGGSQAEASRIFSVSTRTIYNWLQREDLSPRLATRRRRKIDSDRLIAHVREHPDATLLERAAVFGVSDSAIHKALKRLGITKKNDTLS